MPTTVDSAKVEVDVRATLDETIAPAETAYDGLTATGLAVVLRPYTTPVAGPDAALVVDVPIRVKTTPVAAFAITSDTSDDAHAAGEKTIRDGRASHGRADANVQQD